MLRPMSDTRCFVVAEVGSVHDGSLGNAKRLIEAAAGCGADAVKFQTHIAAAETLRSAPPPPYFNSEPRFDYFERTAFSLEQWQALHAFAQDCGIEFLSSPFSLEAVVLLETVGIRRYKIPSGEVTNLPLLRAIAATGRPVLLSSGMSSWDELDRAVELLHQNDLTILQCTSEYPCPPEHVGLNVMLEMRRRYGRPVGLSDHTLSIWAPIAASILGASVVEKHFTFSRKMYGSDAQHSVEPTEFTHMVEGIREVGIMLAAHVDKSETSRFIEMKRTFEKSIVSVVSIARGTLITKEMLDIKKPGTGMPSARLDDVIGRRASRDIAKDALLAEDDVSWAGGIQEARNDSTVA